jgi:hypothetical protein
MSLEVAAGVIGILAAAGKVAESLGPFISAFKHAPQHSQTILTEVKTTRAVLISLQTLFDDLNTTPRRRKELIQVDILQTTLTDGVLVFSELEALVDGLGDPASATSNRARWARKIGEIESLCTRLQTFKSLMGLMLHLLRW